MIVSIHDKTMRSSICHGLTVVREDGSIIQRIQEFDTETYLCCISGGKREVASAFVLPCASDEALCRMLERLPDSMQQFICYEPDAEKVEKACLALIQRQLDKRQQLQDVVNAWDAGEEEEEEDEVDGPELPRA